MKKLKPGTQYKKDYKRFRNNPKKVEKLFRIPVSYTHLTLPTIRLV